MQQQKEQVWIVSARVVSLAAFAFFAGLGLRGLQKHLAPGDRAQNSSGYQLASAAPRNLGLDLRPAELYLGVLKKLQVYYVEQLPTDTQLALGSVHNMLAGLKDPNTRLLSKTELEALQSEARGEFTGMGALVTVQSYSMRKEDDKVATDKGPAKVIGKLPANSPAKDEPAVDPFAIPTITVVSVEPGSPAEKAGLQPKDHITEVDGHWISPEHVSFRELSQRTEDIGPQDLRPRDPNEEPEKPKSKLSDADREKLRKELEEYRNRWKGSTEMPLVLQTLMTQTQGEHELTIERGKPAKTVKVKVAFGRTQVAPVTSKMLNDNTGLLKIQTFSSNAVEQVGDALATLQKSGAKNLVVDLRENPGGNIEAARDIAGLLAGDGKFAILKERDATRKLVENPMDIKGATVKLKAAALSVLVDGGTSGTAELLAAALRDNMGAKLVGSTTFGDGTLQEVVRLDDGTGISITRAHMLTSKGVEFNGTGLKADVAPSADPLDTAVKSLTGVRTTARRG